MSDGTELASILCDPAAD